MSENESSIPSYTGGGLAELRTIPENRWKWEVTAYAQSACAALTAEENLRLASPNTWFVYWATELFRQVFQNGLIEFFSLHCDSMPAAIDAMLAIGKDDYADILH
jgi:hypothetical protein